MKKLILTAVIFLIFGLIFSVPKISYAQSCDCLPDGSGSCWPNTNNCVGDNSPKCELESGGYCSCSCAHTDCGHLNERCCLLPGDPPLQCQTGLECRGKDAICVKGTAGVCDFAGTNQSACNTCMGEGKGAWTALGCIHTDPSAFIGEILRIGIGIGGGIAFLLMLFGGFQILTSAGNPEKLNAGKELVTSAITGLLIIIFSLFILRLIGFTIFAIPGFG